MDVLKTGEAIFFSNRVQLISFGYMIIDIEDIDHLEYVKPTLINYLLVAAGFGASGPGPAVLCLYLNKKIGGTTLYSFRMKAKEVAKLPQEFLDKL